MATSTRMVISMLTLGALTAAAGCTKSGETRGDTTVSGGAVVGASTAVAPPASVGFTDANIAAILDAANASDSAFGAMAVKKGKSADVKSFGRLMMGEHHALRAEGQQLVTRLGITPQEPANFELPNQQKQAMDELQQKTGAEFDKAYIDHEVTFHQQVIETAQKALGDTQNAELKALLEKAAPVLQKHLDRAKEIQTKLGSGTT